LAARILESRYFCEVAGVLKALNGLKSILGIKANHKSTSDTLAGNELAQDITGKLDSAAIHCNRRDVFNRARIQSLKFFGIYY